MLEDRPQLKYLMLHNINTIGTDVDIGLLGLLASKDATLSFKVIPRKIEAVGGGLASVNGKARLFEGLALPREGDEI
jgi:UDP-N-acetylglucosamine pyrophosphorylase